MLERDLRIPIANWILARGLIPICEVGSLYNCDFIGVRLTQKPWTVHEMIAVELKLKDVRGVLRQCANHLQHCNEVWAALPPLSARLTALFDATPIGLLEVNGETVYRVREAKHFERDSFVRWHRIAIKRREEYKGRLLREHYLSDKTIAIRDYLKAKKGCHA